MTLITADQAIFFSVSAILLTCLANSLTMYRRRGKIAHEGFWLWGLAFLPLAYLGYGLGPWLGLPSLVVANASFLLAYISLALQLRFWHTGKSKIPVWIYVACIAYFIGFEFLRAQFPYAARATFGQTTIWAVTVYLLITSIKLYRQSGSIQMLLLSGTFAIESVCAASRVLLLWLVQMPGPDPSHLLAEPFYMVITRWVWIVATAMSYLTVMTYVLEKILNRNEELNSLLREKRQLLNAMAQLTRNRNAGETAGVLTHELAQPMTTIYLASHELQNQIAKHGHEDLRALGELLGAESARSTRIMKRLEQLFRSPNLPKQAVSMASVIDNALTALAPRLQTNHIHITRNGQWKLTVNGETTQLEAVFINLISNAMNALISQTGQRSIKLTCSQHDGMCIVEVQDNGPGIDPLVLEFWGKPYVSDREQGSGIGLWLSKLIIDTHGGNIEISRSKPTGTLARVSLPL